MKKKLTLILTAALTISTLLLPVTSFCTTHSIAKTARQPKLSAKKLIMKTGQTKKLKVKIRKKLNGVQITNPLLQLINQDL